LWASAALLHEMAKAGIALPSALWVSQAIDWEMEKVPKAERQSMLRLMQVFSEHSASPELPDEAVLRRAFKSLAASQIQSMQENAQLRQYIEDLEATVAAERHQSEGQALQARGELTTAKLKAAEATKDAQDWKKRCNGWKRNCQMVEKKYQRLAALAQRKLKLLDDGKPRPELDLPETEEADAVMAQLSDVPKPKPKKKSEDAFAASRKFKLGDDLEPPKGFGVRADGTRYGPKFSSAARFGPGADNTGDPAEQSQSWQQTSRSDAERRPPRGVGRRPWKDHRAPASGEEYSSRVTDQLETVSVLHKRGRLSDDEYAQAKDTILTLSLEDDTTVESFMVAARGRSPSPQRPQTAPTPSTRGSTKKSKAAKPIDAEKAKASLEKLRGELGKFEFENVAELFVFFDDGHDYVTNFQLAKGLKILVRRCFAQAASNPNRC